MYRGFILPPPRYQLTSHTGEEFFLPKFSQGGGFWKVYIRILQEQFSVAGMGTGTGEYGYSKQFCISNFGLAVFAFSSLSLCLQQCHPRLYSQHFVWWCSQTDWVSVSSMTARGVFLKKGRQIKRIVWTPAVWIKKYFKTNYFLWMCRLLFSRESFFSEYIQPLFCHLRRYEIFKWRQKT